MKEGLHFIRLREGLPALVFLAFVTTLLGFSLTAFLPVIVQSIFHRGPATYQLFLISSGAGSILGAVAVASSGKLKEQGHFVLITLLLLGASITGFALSRSLWVSCLLLFLAGVTVMASASLMLSLVQLIVSDQMRGRVMSVYNLAFRLGMPAGSLALGKVIPVIGISAALAGSGVALIVITLFFLVAMRDVPIFSRRVPVPDTAA